MMNSYSSCNPQIQLSTEELLDISQAINREFALNLATPVAAPVYPDELSPPEMLAISTEISADYAPNPDNNPDELVILPVDPDHLYAYWHVEAPQAMVACPDWQPHWTLRVYADADQPPLAPCPSWFDLAVNNCQDQQQVALPEHTANNTYHASLGDSGAGAVFATLADSNQIHLPASIAATMSASAISVSAPPVTRLPATFKVSGDGSYHYVTNASGLGKTQAQ